ncbi:MAG TPA: protein kinase, partial [Ktedonobacterales bacterium]
MANRVGQQLGSYRLLRLLGTGGFAEVYLGEHIHLKSQAAIKVLHASLAKEQQQDFLAEAQTVARLKHPHIVGVLEFGIEGSTPYLVMDFAPYGTLRTRYPRGERLPLPILLSSVRQMADALAYAHEHQVVHRDIKPENMLIDAQGQIVLSDFGIATVAHSSRSQSIEEVVGTVFYMAPEQLMGKPRPASDQYALGVVTYEWLTGKLPFQGSFAEAASQQLFEQPPSLRGIVPSLSPALEEVVLTALAKDPKARFASVQDFAAALERASQVEISFAPSILSDMPPPRNPDASRVTTRLDPYGTQALLPSTGGLDSLAPVTIPSDTIIVRPLPKRRALRVALPLVSVFLVVLLLSSFAAANLLSKHLPAGLRATSTTPTHLVTILTDTATATAIIPPPVIVKATLASSGGQIPSITQFLLPEGNAGPIGITGGPDGNVWFVESDTSGIGRITPAGTITNFPLSHPFSSPFGITRGLDGALWFTEQNPASSAGWIGRITPAGQITEFAAPDNPRSIATGPDGSLWFTCMDGRLGRMTTSGSFTMVPLPGPQQAEDITTGPDHNLWFTESPGAEIGRITPA